MKAYSAKDLWAYEDMLYTLQSALNTANVYEVFTKDEVITMLTEIQTEIEELDTPPAYQDEDYFLIGTNRCSELIQHKINTLKESRNDN
jgi:hypothetical protein